MSLLESDRQNPFRLAEITRREDFGALLDRCFPVAEGGHFFDDFPVWDPARGPAGVTRLGLYHGERLAACAGMRLARLHTETPVALIGAVASDAEFRSQGLASRLVDALVERAERSGAALSMLWGSEHSMYARLGFELAGGQVRASLSALELPEERIQFHQGWTDGIFEAIRKRGSGLVLEERDLEWYAHHEGTFWFRVEEQGRVVAYAALGRGIDLGGIVHEWGGEREPLGRLLASIRRCIPEAELLGPPGVPDFGLDRFPSEHLALVRVLDPEAAKALAAKPLWIWGLDAV